MTFQHHSFGSATFVATTFDISHLKKSFEIGSVLKTETNMKFF